MLQHKWIIYQVIAFSDITLRRNPPYTNYQSGF